MDTTTQPQWITARYSTTASTVMGRTIASASPAHPPKQCSVLWMNDDARDHTCMMQFNHTAHKQQRRRTGVADAGTHTDRIFISVRTANPNIPGQSCEPSETCAYGAPTSRQIFLSVSRRPISCFLVDPHSRCGLMTAWFRSGTTKAVTPRQTIPEAHP